MIITLLCKIAMKLFRKDSNYAVRTLVYIAQQNISEPISSTRVSVALGIPKNFLRRIFSTLIRVGILNATEGARGGVTLAKPPEQISVWDIIHGLQGEMKICNSYHKNDLCEDNGVCVISKRIIFIEQLIIHEFKKITIQTLIDDVNLQRATA